MQESFNWIRFEKYWIGMIILMTIYLWIFQMAKLAFHLAFCYFLNTVEPRNSGKQSSGSSSSADFFGMTKCLPFELLTFQNSGKLHNSGKIIGDQKLCYCEALLYIFLYILYFPINLAEKSKIFEKWVVSSNMWVILSALKIKGSIIWFTLIPTHVDLERRFPSGAKWGCYA